MNNNVKTVAETEAAILARLPAADEGFNLGPSYGRRLVNEAFLNLLRTGRVKRVDGYLLPQERSPERERFRQQVLAALVPVLDNWCLSLTPTEQRRELVYAFDSQIQMSSKVCSACGDRLPRNAFGLNAARRDGLQSVCRECRRK